MFSWADSLVKLRYLSIEQWAIGCNQNGESIHWPNRFRTSNKLNSGLFDKAMLLQIAEPPCNPARQLTLIFSKDFDLFILLKPISMKKSLIPLLGLVGLLGWLAWSITQPASGENPVLAIDKPLNKSLRLPNSGAAQALDRWWASRAYPFESLPQDAWAKATQDHLTNRQSPYKHLSTQWESMGPHNIGGRSLYMAMNPQNPQTMWLGSAGGGLWRSYTAGVGANAWHRVSTGFPILGVASIAINPNDSNEIYIGTGEVYNYQRTGTRIAIRTTRGTYGIGILKSTDAGATWSKSLDWAYDELRGVQDLQINPENPDHILAATSEGIYQSLDAGTNWMIRDTHLMATSLYFHPFDTSIVIAGVGNMGSPGGGIYRSTNGGASWTNNSAGIPFAFTGKISLAATHDTPVHFYASVADSTQGYGIFRSTNQGQNWTQINPTDFAIYQGWYSHDVEISPFNRNLLMAVGVNAWKSTNGGGSLNEQSAWWQYFIQYTPPIGGSEGNPNYVHADIHQVVFHPTDSNRIYFVTDGGLFETNDQAQTFAGRNGALQTTQFYANFSNSDQDSLLAMGGMQDNASAIYQGSKAWYKVIGGDGCSASITPGNDNVIFGSLQYLSMYKSTNRGLSFDPVPGMGQSGPPTSFVAPFVMCEDNPSTMYAGRFLLQKSIDGGQNWFFINNGVPLNAAGAVKVVVDPNDCDHLLVTTSPLNGERSRVYRSVNSGNTFSEILGGSVSGTLPNRYYHDVAIHPNDPDTYYIVLGGFGSTHVYKSTNAGAGWLAMSNGLPDVPHNNILIDPMNPDHVYVGNDLGVYASTDAGASWLEYGTGLPEAVIAMDLSLSPTNRKLRVATHGNGVYQVDMIGPSTGLDQAPFFSAQPRLAPNPAAEQSVLKYALAEPSPVKVSLRDLQGRLVREIANEVQAAGRQSLLIDVSGLSAGMYLVVVENGKDSDALRLLVRE